jgi:hypothetical protein
VNALANPEVGKYINKYFVSSFQKVATFRIVNGQKQGGNVASYFCAPDGRVLHVVAGPVDANTMLKEAKWVVDNTYKAMKEANGDGAAFKAYFRKAHANRLRSEHGVVAEPVTYDPVVEVDPNSALTYKDPTGRPLAPKLPPAPINGPDVKLRHLQQAEANALGARAFHVKGGGLQVVLGNQGQVHQLMSAHCLVKIEDIYGAIFEGILGEQISTRPVEIVNPFPWVQNGGAVPNGALILPQGGLKR